ncbi:MAG: mechanosensitive ion channel [Alphaproteobacteria bacterium]|nr:mechanosensitive ion channel [Alphaproteobacteria bacterium]
MSPHEIWVKYAAKFTDSAINAGLATLLLIIGIWASGAVAGWVRRISKRQKRIDDTLAAFFASIVRWVLIAIVLIAVLDRFGVQTTQIVAVLGAATLAIGLALQGTLSNVAAGVMLVLFRPYRLGDVVEVAGQIGAVKDVNIFTTELATPDNIKIVLPNGQCWGAPIRNFTALPTRRLDLDFGVAYDVDLAVATAVIDATVRADRRVLGEPAPLVKVKALGDFSVTILASVWCATPDLYQLRFDLLRSVKEALDRAGVTIPFPTNVTYQVDGTQKEAGSPAPSLPRASEPEAQRPETQDRVGGK